MTVDVWWLSVSSGIMLVVVGIALGVMISELSRNRRSGRITSAVQQPTWLDGVIQDSPDWSRRCMIMDLLAAQEIGTALTEEEVKDHLPLSHDAMVSDGLLVAWYLEVLCNGGYIVNVAEPNDLARWAATEIGRERWLAFDRQQFERAMRAELADVLVVEPKRHWRKG